MPLESKYLSVTSNRTPDRHCSLIPFLSPTIKLKGSCYNSYPSSRWCQITTDILNTILRHEYKFQVWASQESLNFKLQNSMLHKNEHEHTIQSYKHPQHILNYPVSTEDCSSIQRNYFSTQIAVCQHAIGYTK